MEGSHDAMDETIFKQLLHQAGLQILETKNIEEAVACNVDAYEGYPLYPALFGKYSSNKLVAKVWRSSILTLNHYATLIVDSPAVNGFLCLCPPGYHGMPSVQYLLKSGLQNIMPISTYMPMIRYEKYCMDMKQRNMPQDGWYIYDLVVRKEAQNQGLAKRLLQPCLKFFDYEKQCVYLETHDPKNIAFYEHFGFVIVETGTVPHSDLTHYGLLRDPKVM